MKERISGKECHSNLTAVGDALYVINGKWKLKVIVALREGNSRFNDIQRAVKGISAGVLSNELKELELNGFVKRNVYTQSSIAVEYVITDYSNTLGNVLHALAEWGTMHRNKIKQERHLEAAEA